MPDPASATATQLRNIEQATGLSMADFAREVTDRGIDGHAKIIAFLKAEHGLSHGNANAVAHIPTQRLIGLVCWQGTTEIKSRHAL